MPQPDHLLNPASLEWQNEAPLSQQYEDMYFNLEEGIEESEFVFVTGNRLEDRFVQVKQCFTIAETGFGTGLNFFCARRLWLDQAPADSRLHYISVEKHPLNPQDLERALSAWPQFRDGCQQLLAQYPVAVAGFHRLSFDGGRITLTLLFGDAAASYSKLDASVDAWFLDGFAPSKNPDMWQQSLFDQMARLSHEATSFATFTAAGFVKRGLQQAGFTVEKAKGFGRKRERLIGRFSMDENTETISPSPWFDRPAATSVRQVTVVGAGLSGCSTAAALAARGIKVTLLDQSDSIATAGSGNRQGALYAKLPMEQTPQGQLHLSGFLYSLRLLRQLDPDQNFWSDCGLIQLACTEKEQGRQQTLLERQLYPRSVVRGVTTSEATEIAGQATPFDGLYFPQAGWVHPKALCRELIQHPLITCITHQKVSGYQYDSAKEQWKLSTAEGNHYASSHLVICTAEAANQLPQTSYLKLKPIRGQVTHCSSDESATKLETVVCGDGYISPAMDGQYCFGATFDLHTRHSEIREEDHDYNFGKLQKALPGLADSLRSKPKTGRVAFRCATPDYLPIVGPVPDYDAFVYRYAKLGKDRKWPFPAEVPPHHPGLYLNTGHGSKGLITCPIGGELVAAMICNEPLPVEYSLAAIQNPARFIIKQLIKGTI
ncbi:bifunctional tRNA (5-methylaminomethyl-2-thiouridine)(34)-methyltransferase MnmD/FAD-dependent 5-carboxymethylaminomethyl-2-thiouridine(34) oxidoreductase MnmC [Marinobacterium jannaschii]|uniref:bifunctional tRNA (5-methylaminomethyl-2-thiouridine)(34)-methyltransferase MnmD/FAD-dependent 5-carboxymethylaminomethyl-2-thiouridine(34) oxidoreductase MnmC n=1 Tax=Marinobacterium jannaschii TaxID=64970 RepID=UPI000482B2E6|nr:bifunctional tRNA (5-methylaminomethyl-2-thiouridine)(34)-methyltransferase MnmD/FAD-dependent 5-carboxymethylaminomethyl-2-thiouridine(34) oxidoreductase MnmC [Marinobacterium jannaschii]